jgi:autoinducer 2-degrading protein
MLVVQVFVHVKPDAVEAFKAATLENARNSILEAGVDRFDIVQDVADPTRFVLIEAYHSVEATVLHKETRHYEVWRDTVADMMAEPRTSSKSNTVFWTR